MCTCCRNVFNKWFSLLRMLPLYLSLLCRYSAIYLPPHLRISRLRQCSYREVQSPGRWMRTSGLEALPMTTRELSSGIPFHRLWRLFATRLNHLAMRQQTIAQGMDPAIENLGQGVKLLLVTVMHAGVRSRRSRKTMVPYRKSGGLA